ncbi:FkbM family methyltransferase [Agriterribacter sp.]|uniref:FkbM family methyltransferase n=1 Tax=Agriterribacter sp. TaxID=2821509 RepID=UPI002BF1FFEE|nr:FkbM family methyltransferase [Agriterribacter sp.]HRO44568.1 FkbM family methyltransferase [Agriterribacter sp.]HRQ16005.1 FkbM family methyltransferase [Agriterribacter sp.]
MDAFLRSLPVFRGKSRLAKLLFKNSLLKQRDITIKGKYGCSFLLPNLYETIGFDIFVNGMYEPETVGFLCNKLLSGATFLDLGANIGAITVPLAMQRKDINIVCVEAAPWLVSYLKKNLAANELSGIRVVDKALYNSDDLELNFYSPREKFGKGSLSPVFTHDAVKVKTITLDTLIFELKIGRVDLIKIDVEGYERNVFMGGKNLLTAENAPDILFEFVDWAEKHAGFTPGDAQRLLADWGYTLYTMNTKGKIHLLPGVITKGSGLLFASKKSISS